MSDKDIVEELTAILRKFDQEGDTQRARLIDEAIKSIHAIETANRTQARFQDFARASSDWYMELDAAFNITSISERFTAIVGVRASDFVGRPILTLEDAHFHTGDLLEIERALRSTKPFRYLPIRFTEGEASYVYIMSGVPTFNRNTGDFLGYRCAVLQGDPIAERIQSLGKLDFEHPEEAMEKLDECLSVLEGILERHVPEDEWKAGQNTLPLGVSRKSYDALRSATETARRMREYDTNPNRLFAVLDWILEILKSIRPISQKVGEIVAEGIGIVSDIAATGKAIKFCAKQIAAILNETKEED